MWLSLVLMAVQAAPAFDTDQFIKDHAQELKAELQRSRSIRSLSDDQALIVYDQCLSKEAASLLHTTVTDDQIFPLARQRCLALKADLLNGSPPARFMRFKALDDAKSSSFPALTKQLRERRRAFDTENGKPPVVKN